jgi:hypothetical protein
MEQAGAPSAAVAFARRIDSEGYLTGFRDAGRVDVGRATYPFRANENNVCFLLNGDPPTIDVDDPDVVRASALESPSYAGAVRAHPRAAVFPGDRFHPAAVREEPLPDGGQRFLVSYLLRDGCHACAVVGRLVLAFEFDATGRLVRTAVASAGPEQP